MKLISAALYSVLFPSAAYLFLTSNTNKQLWVLSKFIFAWNTSNWGLLSAQARDTMIRADCWPFSVFY